MANSLNFKTRLVRSSKDWLYFETLLRTYAANDLDQPHLSSIWQDLEDLPARYGPPTGTAVLLVHQPHHNSEEIVVGCGALAQTKLAGACEIKRLFIHNEYRGKGGSKVLIHDLLHSAQVQGYDQAVLSTWKSNHTGLALYQTLGFQHVPAFKSHPNPELIFLGRPLRAPDAQKLS
jgi:putative acetyltransferase